MTAANERREQVRAWFDNDWEPEQVASALGWPLRDVERHFDALLDEHGGKTPDYHLAKAQPPKHAAGEGGPSRNWAERKPPRPLMPHGTVAAYKRHRRAGEEACRPCVDAWSAYNADLAKQRRERRAAVAESVAAGAPPPPPPTPRGSRKPYSNCGSYGGYISHRRRKETACDPCMEAKRAYNSTRNLTKSARAAADEGT